MTVHAMYVAPSAHALPSLKKNTHYPLQDSSHAWLSTMFLAPLTTLKSEGEDTLSGGDMHQGPCQWTRSLVEICTKDLVNRSCQGEEIEAEHRAPQSH